MSSLEAAKKIVEEIADECGYIPEELLAQIPSETRRVIEHKMRKKDSLASHAIKT